MKKLLVFLIVVCWGGGALVMLFGDPKTGTVMLYAGWLPIYGMILIETAYFDDRRAELAGEGGG